MQPNQLALRESGPVLAKGMLHMGKGAYIRLVSPHHRSNALTDQIDTLTLANRRKDELLAILSHELRSPLAAIQNAITVLRSALTRGQLQLQHARIDLVTVLSNAMETVEPDFNRRSQIFTSQVSRASVWVLADASRLEQVFVNLLTNASKYTDEGGQIALSLQLQDGFAVVRVKDSGIGIEAHLLPDVFELFMQVSATSGRARSGVGVGLALVRKIVEMHQGSVTATSAGLGQGSEFVVRLRAQA